MYYFTSIIYVFMRFFYKHERSCVFFQNTVAIFNSTKWLHDKKIELDDG
jgi:hypothetical protein